MSNESYLLLITYYFAREGSRGEFNLPSLSFGIGAIIMLLRKTLSSQDI
ncbi:MAG: hypothetical protein V7K67_34590 [Nostoc sp.]